MMLFLSRVGRLTFTKSWIVASLIAIGGCSKSSSDGSMLPSQSSSTASIDSKATAPSSSKYGLREDQAIQLIYGGAQWDDARLAGYFSTESGSNRPGTHAFVSTAFIDEYNEAGRDEVAFIARLTPEPIEQYDCHGCEPVIGGAIFVRTGSTWKVESKAEILGAIAAWGNHFSIVELGKERHGILIHMDDSHQGYESKSITLLAATGATLSSVLATGFSESPGDGVCEDAKPQKIELAFAPQADSEYFNAIVELQQNMGECGHLVVDTRRTEYAFEEGKYLPIISE